MCQVFPVSEMNCTHYSHPSPDPLESTRRVKTTRNCPHFDEPLEATPEGPRNAQKFPAEVRNRWDQFPDGGKKAGHSVLEEPTPGHRVAQGADLRRERNLFMRLVSLAEAIH
jgi:hypothetical protein